MLWHIRDSNPPRVIRTGRRPARRSRPSRPGSPAPGRSGQPWLPDRGRARQRRPRARGPQGAGRPGRRDVPGPPRRDRPAAHDGASSTSCPSRASPTPRPRARWSSCATSGFAVDRRPDDPDATGSTGPPQSLPRLIQRVLANDAVEQADRQGPLPFDHLGQGQHYDSELVNVPIRATGRRRR